MENFERKKIQATIGSIDITCQELQIQILNNIDRVLMSQGVDEASKKAVENFVKQPIKDQIYRLQAEKSNLMKLVQQVHPQSSKVNPA